MKEVAVGGQFIWLVGGELNGALDYLGSWDGAGGFDYKVAVSDWCVSLN